MKHLRTYEFKPFVIFIKPPSLDRLRETRRNAKIISSKDDKGTAKPFTVSIIRHGRTWVAVKSFVVAVYLESKGDHCSYWQHLSGLTRASGCFSTSLALHIYCGVFIVWYAHGYLQFPCSSDFMSLKNPCSASISLWEIMHLGLDVSIQI